MPSLILTPPATSTNDLTRDFLLAATALFPDAIMWRNNRVNATFRDKGKRRHVKAGINGQGDITASIPVTFHGRKFGVRFEFEIKFGSDKQSLIQKAFEYALVRSGGVYLIVRDVAQGIADLAEIVRRMESE